MRTDHAVDPNPQTNFRRIEEKFRLTPREAITLYSQIAARTTVEEFIPGQTISTLTTLYCDGVELPFFHTARAGGVRNRIRVRLYGDLQDTSDSFGWVEWKLSPPRGEKGYTTKKRFRVPRERLACFFNTPLNDEEIRSFQKNKKNAEEAVECYHQLRQLTTKYSLHPLVASHYHRQTLLLGEGCDRATFDFDLGYSLVSWKDNALRLTNTVLDGAVIVEFKYSSPLDSWLRELASSFQPAVGFSKFERALELCWLSSPNYEIIK
jgi:hypothetical protein